MSFLDAVVRALMLLVLIFIGYWLCIWVFTEMGFGPPPMVAKGIAVLFVLFAVLVLLRLLGPFVANIQLWPPNPPNQPPPA